MAKDDFNSFMREMVSSNFFTDICSFTREEREQKEDWIALTKGSLLLDAFCNMKWEFKGLSDEVLISYIVWARESFDDCQKNTLRSVMEYLEDAFQTMQEDINKEEIPELIYQAGKAMYEGVNSKNFSINYVVNK